jgi:hypothetical protein
MDGELDQSHVKERRKESKSKGRITRDTPSVGHRWGAQTITGYRRSSHLPNVTCYVLYFKH